jgi:hypothetical protein
VPKCDGNPKKSPAASSSRSCTYAHKFHACAPIHRQGLGNHPCLGLMVAWQLAGDFDHRISGPPRRTRKPRSNPKWDETARTPLSPWTVGHWINTTNPKHYAITTCDDPIQCPSLGHRWTVDTSCTKSAWFKIADNRVTVGRMICNWVPRMKICRMEQRKGIRKEKKQHRRSKAFARSGTPAYPRRPKWS